MSINAAAFALICLVSACGAESPTGGPPPPAIPVTPTTPTPEPVTTVPEAGSLVKRSITVGGTSYLYQVFVPKAYSTAKKWPVVLFIHGGNERGTDGDKQTTTGLGVIVKAQLATFPAIVVFPQIPPGEGLDRGLMLDVATAPLDLVLKTYAVDSTRIYAAGVSMGGGMLWELAMRTPTRFAALAPMSQLVCDPCITGVKTTPLMSTYPMVSQSLKNIPVWMFHGTRDEMVDLKYPHALVQAFKDVGGKMTYTEMNGTDHGTTWGRAFQMPELYDWLWAQHR